jgi:hypothetical protein
MVVGIGDGPGDGTCRTEACLQWLLQGFAEAAGATDKPRESKVTLAGSSRRLLQLDGTVDGKPVRVLMAIVERPEGRRILNCFAGPSADARCRAAFEILAGVGWREPAPAYLGASAARDFAGRPYVESSGCSATIGSSAGAVQCDDKSTVIWEVTTDPAASESKLSQPYTRLSLIEKPASCVVDGVATTCRSFRPANGKNVGGDMARVLLRGRTVVVACTNLDPVVVLPRACSGLLTVNRPPSNP